MKYFFLSILIAGFILFGAAGAHAAPIPGLEFLNVPDTANIGDLLASLYIWGIGFVALAAFFMLTAGGVRYMLAGDRDPTEAKAWMRNAIYGLLLALGSYLILNTINPQLVSIKSLKLPPIQQPTSAVTYYCAGQSGGKYLCASSSPFDNPGCKKSDGTVGCSSAATYCVSQDECGK